MENDQLTEFNTTIQIWIDALDDYTLEKLRMQPGLSGWSLGQMYRHILDDTEWFVSQMAAALATSENSEREMHPDAVKMFRKNGFPDEQIKGPATNKIIPQPESKEEFQRRLAAIKSEVNRLFADYDPLRHIGKTRHPGLWFFSADEWLQFAEMHMRHHLRQKARIELGLLIRHN